MAGSGPRPPLGKINRQPRPRGRTNHRNVLSGLAATRWFGRASASRAFTTENTEKGSRLLAKAQRRQEAEEYPPHGARHLVCPCLYVRNYSIIKMSGDRMI